MRFLYNEKSTVFHRMSPQAKLAGLLVSFVFPVAFNHPAYLAVVAALALGYVTVAGAWDVVARFKRLLIVLLIVSWALWSVLLREGNPVFDWGAISISSTSLLFGVAMGLRLATYVVIGLAFLATTSVEELTSALRRLGLPFSVGFALSTSFRLVPTFVETTRTVTEAQRSRGLSLEHGNPIARAKKYLPLIIPVLAICIRRANSMAMALEARGFGAGGKRSSLFRSRLSAREGILLVAFVFAAACAIFLRVSGFGELVPGRL